jgi:hypothetical protein
MLPAKIYQFTIPANGMYPLPVNGTMFKVLSSTSTLSVAGDSFGTLGAVLSGQGLRDAPFQLLQFTDTSGGANLVRVLVADSGFIDDRVSGEVSVIDGGKARTLAGQVCIATGNISLVAAKNSALGIWLPAGQTRRLIVKRAYVSSPTAQTIYALDITAALTSTSAPKSMNLNGQAYAGAALTTYDNLAAQPGGSAIVGVFQVQASQMLPIQFDEPFTIQTGHGLAFFATAQGTDFMVTVPALEEPL